MALPRLSSSFKMVTGRSVSRSIRDWLGVRRRRRLQDLQRLQTSILATHSNDHPDVPTPQSIRLRLQLPECQLGLQHNIPGRWEPGLLGDIQQPWTVVQPQGNSQFLFSPLECWHQPRLGLHEFQPEQPTAGQTCPRKVPVVTMSALPHNGTKIQGSCPQQSGEALELSQGHWKCFCLLTGESVERLPPPDTLDIERAYQNFCESLLSAAKQYPTWPSEELCAMLRQRVPDLLSLLYLSPSGDCLWQSHLILLSWLQQKKQERWEETVKSIDFLHSSCKVLRTINKFTGRSGRSSHLCLVSANSIASQLVKNGAHKTAGSSTNSCLTYGRF